MMRVLVTDGEMNKALAVVRAISDDTTWTGVTSRFPLSPAGVSRHTDAQHWLRDATPDGVVDGLNRLAGDYDALLPVGGGTFEIVSEHRDRLDFPVERLLPPQDAMRVALDKHRTYAHAEREGIPVPNSARVTDSDDLREVIERVGFPAVLKTGSETEARFVRIAENADELRDAYRAYTADHDVDPVVQAYLPGATRGYFGLFDDGDLLGGYAHRRVREYPPEGGASACAESTQDDELRAYAEGLLGPLDWTGVAMIEFKEDAAGTPSVVEINPKIWGSLDLAIASGMNFPAALLDLAAGREPRDFTFAPRRVHWPLSGDLTHAWRRPSSAPAVLRDCYSKHTRSNVRLGDPIPHAVEAGITLVRQDL